MRLGSKLNVGIHTQQPEILGSMVHVVIFHSNMQYCVACGIVLAISQLSVVDE